MRLIQLKCMTYYWRVFDAITDENFATRIVNSCNVYCYYDILECTSIFLSNLSTPEGHDAVLPNLHVSCHYLGFLPRPTPFPVPFSFHCPSHHSSEIKYIPFFFLQTRVNGQKNRVGFLAQPESSVHFFQRVLLQAASFISL